MAPTLNITHIGTATAILEINGINFLTDPSFSPAGTSWDLGRIVIKVTEDPALRLDQLPVIDAVLLSHEDHPDNLDELGRQLLNGRPVFTTVDGSKNLAPRPTVYGMRPWDTIERVIAGKRFTIIATPTLHVPGDECTGFLVTSNDADNDFGHDPSTGLPNAVYFTGDTFHVCAAVMNLGNAHAPMTEAPDSPRMQITMGGADGARLFRALGADILVPMHYESWGHFTQFGAELRQVFEAEGISEKICWLKGGDMVKVL
ncbi:putative Zn-dependent hydrolase of the beta-lactamase protein [Aspergillus ellipticus CBS 707.79]|uniref:Putative Zn-dependent hydrolase of the beta-lactamase protein n=1 Tax=Aspergillus ellipticus CBS 707.79 TaxID=1448320 RepID=A0A319DAY2_9EURO|nr:putative Zn-dependent hydrolase of the beta-lactamase protein [Aspergillus ellipticus CBS 707.79]